MLESAGINQKKITLLKLFWKFVWERFKQKHYLNSPPVFNLQTSQLSHRANLIKGSFTQQGVLCCPHCPDSAILQHCADHREMTCKKNNNSYFPSSSKKGEDSWERNWAEGYGCGSNFWWAQDKFKLCVICSIWWWGFPAEVFKLRPCSATITQSRHLSLLNLLLTWELLCHSNLLYVVIKRHVKPGPDYLTWNCILFFIKWNT